MPSTSPSDYDDANSMIKALRGASGVDCDIGELLAVKMQTFLTYPDPDKPARLLKGSRVRYNAKNIRGYFERLAKD